MKKVTLVHKKTKIAEDVPKTHVGAYLANGWGKEHKSQSKEGEPKAKEKKGKAK